jgi:hypothetical protein
VAPGLPRQPGGVQVGESPGADPSAGPPPDSGQETGESGADATAAEPGDGGASPSPWALDDVNEAIGRRFVPSGLQEKYQSNITRREFCALVAKFLRASASRSGIGDRLGAAEAGESPFTDVDDSAVTLAFGLGVVNGIGDGLFNPDGDITRQEAAIMLANLSRGVLGVESEPPPIGYGDAGSVAEWAQSGVAFVTEHGIMSGVGENAFAPLNPYTREQSILTVLRLSKAFISE